MIGAILRRALAVVTDGTRLPVLPKAIAVIASGDALSLEQYLELDDQVLLGAIHAWEDAKDPVLADLCRRLRARALFKTIELSPDARSEDSSHAFACPDEPTRERALATAKEIAKSAGLDPDLYVGLDIASDMPYSEDDSLHVVFPQGKPRPPSEVSFLLDRLRNETLTRCRIIFAPELREAMRKALIH
jgi:HD superfamily phosphohydrolase